MTNLNPNSLKNLPDLNGRFGEFGGRFVAETLMPLILSVENAYEKASNDKVFLKNSKGKLIISLWVSTQNKIRIK